MEVIVIGLLTAVGFYIVMLKIGIRKFTGYNWQTDLGVTILVSAMFLGTLTGMIIAVIAGITMSVLLTVSKLVFGAQKLTEDGWIDITEWETLQEEKQ